MLSRLFPTLIRLNHVIKLTNAKTQLKRPSRFSVFNPALGSVQGFQFKAMSTDVEKELGDPKRHFDYKQLIEKKKDNNVVLIDVRELSEIQETGKIPGSIHIPLAELKNALNEISEEDFKKKYGSDKPKKSAEVIFSCKAGVRSLKALKIGLELGYDKAGNYKGGWLDWAENSKLSQ